MGRPCNVYVSSCVRAMIVMVIKLATQVCRRSNYEEITGGDQFWKALKQLLPLAAFPMLFAIFEIPVLLFHVYATQRSKPIRLLAGGVCFSLWGTASGATVLIHISVTQICGKKHKPIKPINASGSRPLLTERLLTVSHVNSATRFSISAASV